MQYYIEQGGNKVDEYYFGFEKHRYSGPFRPKNSTATYNLNNNVIFFYLSSTFQSALRLTVFI